MRATPTQSRADDAEGSLGGTGGDDANPRRPDTEPEDSPPVSEDPAPSDDNSSHVLLRDDPLGDLDAPIVLDDPGFRYEPATPTAPTAPPPEPHEALDWGDPEPAPAPSPAPARPPSDTGRSPMIDAPQAGRPADREPSSAPVFDFDDERPEPQPEPDPDQPREGSRFSFRYLVDDDG